MTLSLIEDAGVVVRPLTGADLAASIDALAELRIAVFRAYPYLYDGSLAYERGYVEEFAASAGAVLVAAFAGDTLIGAATASPMAGQKEAFRAPFEAAGYDTATMVYFGESVLLPAWRGRGVGHAFFDHREARARQLGATHTTFCSVVRPPDHPARPAAYRPLDDFWRKRGYAPVEDLVTRFAWKDVGETGESEKPMRFWMRRLD
jgi:N-acetylglutamate synthase and related acetyltransferases